MENTKDLVRCNQADKKNKICIGCEHFQLHQWDRAECSGSNTGAFDSKGKPVILHRCKATDQIARCLPLSKKK